jgi:hypothetical protein
MKTLKTFFLFAILTVGFISCTDTNADALKQAGIQLSQKDSIIAQQSYRCNYTFSYIVDTLDFVVVNGKATSKIDATGLIKRYNSPVFEFKHYTTWQCDSAISAFYKQETKDLKIFDKASNRTYTINGFLTIIYDTVRVQRSTRITSYILAKNYTNLYNSKKID